MEPSKVTLRLWPWATTLRTPGTAAKASLLDRSLELQVQATDGAVLERVHALDDDEASLAQDAHAVGHALDLGQAVAGEEDRAPVVAHLADDLLQLLLHERVQAAAGLVEDEQVRPAHEGLDEGHLLLVAGREVGDLA